MVNVPCNFQPLCLIPNNFFIIQLQEMRIEIEDLILQGYQLVISKRLRAPDDYFMLSQALSFQHYNLKNYNTGLFTFGDGESNNLSYTIGLSRSDTFNDPIYPIGGSSFSVSAKFSLPYSLFNNVDYKALADERA